jgi:translation elongation factor EF-Tu-like GTPase
MNKQKGRFEIYDTFKISGRGIVLAGTILEGVINLGDFIRFDFDGQIIDRKITGIDAAMRTKEGKPKAGILIECNNELEIDDLRNWNPNLTIGEIYRM